MNNLKTEDNNNEDSIKTILNAKDMAHRAMNNEDAVDNKVIMKPEALNSADIIETSIDISKVIINPEAMKSCSIESPVESPKVIMNPEAINSLGSTVTPIESPKVTFDQEAVISVCSIVTPIESPEVTIDQEAVISVDSIVAPIESPKVTIDQEAMISGGRTVTPIEGPEVAIDQEAINTEATRNEGCIKNPEIPIVSFNPEATHNEGFVETPFENIKVAMNPGAITKYYEIPLKIAKDTINPVVTNSKDSIETPTENIKDTVKPGDMKINLVNTIDIIEPEYINNKASNDKMETGVMLNTSEAVDNDEVVLLKEVTKTNFKEEPEGVLQCKMRNNACTETLLPIIPASTRSSKLEPYQVSSSQFKSSESQSQPSLSHSKPAKSCLVECSLKKFLDVQTPKVFLSTESLVVKKKIILLQLGCYDPIRNKYLQIPIKEDGLRENAKNLDLTERKKNPSGNLDVGSDELSLEDLKSDIEPQAKKKPTEKLKIPDWKELIHNRFILPEKDDWKKVQIVSLENSGIMYSVIVPKGEMKGVVLGHSNVFRWMNVEPAAGFAYISSTATLDSFKNVIDDVLAKNILNLSGNVPFCSFVGSNDVYKGVQTVTEFMRLQIELVACLHRIPGCNTMITLAEYPYPPESEDIKHVHIFRCNEGLRALNKAYESPRFKTGTLFLGNSRGLNNKKHLCSFKANIQPYNIYINCLDWRNGDVSWKNDKFLKLNDMLKFWLSSTSKGPIFSNRQEHDGVVVPPTSITDSRGKSLEGSLKNWGGSVGNFPEFVFNPQLDVSPILDYKCKFSTWMERNPLNLKLREPRLCKSVFGEEVFVDEEGNYQEMFTLNEGMNKLVEFLEQSAESSALPYLVMYSSAEYITLALKCRKVNVSKRMDDITSGTIVFEKNLQSPEFRNSLKQQHYGAEVKVKKKMSAKLAAELCTWMNYTMEATNCMLDISNLSLSRRETKIFIEYNAEFLCSPLHQCTLKQIPEMVQNNVHSKSLELMKSENMNYVQSNKNQIVQTENVLSKKLKSEIKMGKKKQKLKRRKEKRAERRRLTEQKFRKAQSEWLKNVQNKRPTDMGSKNLKNKQIKSPKNVQRENNVLNKIPVNIQSKNSKNVQSLKLAQNENVQSKNENMQSKNEKQKRKKERRAEERKLKNLTDIRKSSNPNLEPLGANRRQQQSTNEIVNGSNPNLETKSGSKRNNNENIKGSNPNLEPISRKRKKCTQDKGSKPLKCPKLVAPENKNEIGTPLVEYSVRNPTLYQGFVNPQIYHGYGNPWRNHGYGNPERNHGYGNPEWNHGYWIW